MPMKAPVSNARRATSGPVSPGSRTSKSSGRPVALMCHTSPRSVCGAGRSAPPTEPGGLSVPFGITLDYDNAALFNDRAPVGFEIEYVVAVTSNFGSCKVNIYGFLRPEER